MDTVSRTRWVVGHVLEGLERAPAVTRLLGLYDLISPHADPLERTSGGLAFLAGTASMFAEVGTSMGAFAAAGTLSAIAGVAGILGYPIILARMWGDTYYEAKCEIAKRGVYAGYANGAVAGMLGMTQQWVKNELWMPGYAAYAVADVATQVVGAVGFYQAAFNDGLWRGYTFGSTMPLENQIKVLDRLFARWKAEGVRLARAEDLFTFGAITRLAGTYYRMFF